MSSPLRGGYYYAPGRGVKISKYAAYQPPTKIILDMPQKEQLAFLKRGDRVDVTWMDTEAHEWHHVAGRVTFKRGRRLHLMGQSWVERATDP